MKFEIVAIMGDEKKKIIGGASNSCNFLNTFSDATFLNTILLPLTTFYSSNWQKD
jgi:hypothetical protein